MIRMIRPPKLFAVVLPSVVIGTSGLFTGIVRQVRILELDADRPRALDRDHDRHAGRDARRRGASATEVTVTDRPVARSVDEQAAGVDGGIRHREGRVVVDAGRRAGRVGRGQTARSARSSRTGRRRCPRAGGARLLTAPVWSSRERAGRRGRAATRSGARRWTPGRRWRPDAPGCRPAAGVPKSVKAE